MKPLKIKKTADMKEYTKQYNKDHKEDIYKKIICDICGNTYYYNGKTNHNKTKDHQIAVLTNEIEQFKNKFAAIQLAVN